MMVRVWENPRKLEPRALDGPPSFGICSWDKDGYEQAAWTLDREATFDDVSSNRDRPADRGSRRALGDRQLVGETDPADWPSDV